MSEPNNAFPFPGMGTEGDLDISAIFGEIDAGSGVNPFDMPTAVEPAAGGDSAAGEEPAAGGESAISEKPAAGAQPALSQTASVEPEPASHPAAPAEASALVSAAQPQEPEPTPENELVNNPISAAFTMQTEQNTQQGLLEKPPVFCYGSAREPITDSSMTFEELRIAKSDDFPELAEGKKVSWTVEYGKTVKTISDPKGTTILSVKAEIERSKAFLDGLKKAKQKCPDCLVKPKVTAQSKGVAAYKGVFSSLEAARASDKAICTIPGRDGRIYELRRTELGEFIAPKDNIVDFQRIRAGFTPALPRIPLFLLYQIISFFRCYMSEWEEFEALAHILWDKERREFVVHIEQEVSRCRISADLRHDELPEERYLHYADIHSHNSMAAKFSPVDDQDERATRLYIVLGRLDKFFPTISVRMSCGGAFVALDPASVLESVGEAFPAAWHDSVKPRHSLPAQLRQAGKPGGFRDGAR